MAQSLSMTFNKSGKPEKAVNNNQRVSIGNYGKSSSIIAFSLNIKNSHKTKDLALTNLSYNSNGTDIISIPIANTSATVKPGQRYEFAIWYQAPGSISPNGWSVLTFNTNDPDNPTIKVEFEVNPDRGDFNITSSTHSVNSNTIDIGNVKLNSSKDFVLNYENRGKGYLGVSKATLNSPDNKLIFTHNEEHLIYPSYRLTQKTVSVKGLKRGNINSTMEYSLTNDSKKKYTLNIKGKVIAPIAQLEYNGNIITDGAVLNMPTDDYTNHFENITIRNVGDDILTVNSIKEEGDTKDEFNIHQPPTNSDIAPGKTLNCKINIYPKEIGNKSVKFTFVTAGYSSQSISFTVKKLIQAPILTVIDESGNKYDKNPIIDMGNINYGEKVTKSLTIKNTGNKVLTISKFTEVFSFFKIVKRPKMSVAAGESTTIQYEYTFSNVSGNKKPYCNQEIKTDAKNNITNIYSFLNQKYAQLMFLKDGSEYISRYYDFGYVSVNNPAYLDLEIKNKGNIDMNISDIDILDDKNGFYSIVNSLSSNTIKPGTKLPIRVKYAPTFAKESYTAKLRIRSNSSNPDVILNLSGNAQEPGLLLTYMNIIFNNDLIDFGTIDYNTTVTKNFNIKNNGHDPLHIYDFKITTPDGNKVQGWFDNDIDKTLNPGKTFAFNINMKCLCIEHKELIVSFKTNVPGYNNFKFRISLSAKIPRFELYSGSKLTNNQVLEFKKQTPIKFVVKNTGTKIMYIKEMSIDGPDKASFSVSKKIKFVRKGESDNFTINLTESDSNEKSAYLNIKTDDPYNPTIKIVLKGNSVSSGGELFVELFNKKVVNNSTLNKVELDYNTESSNKVTITNNTNNRIRIYDMVLSGTDNKLVADIDNKPDRYLEKGENLSFNIKVKSISKSDKTLTVGFKTTKTGMENFRFNMVFSAKTPVIELHASDKLKNGVDLSFGNKKELDLTLKNSGNAKLIISNMYIDGNDKGNFKLSANIQEIESNSDKSFKINFTANDNAEKRASLIIKTNDPETAEFKIGLIAKTKTSVDVESNDLLYKVYPNPFINNIKIDNRTEKECTVNIYNINGVKIITRTDNSSEININTNFVPGIYILEIISDNHVFSTRVVKK
jgi:hypothetical protein